MLVRDLSPELLWEVVVCAADRHDDVERHVRLAAARGEGDLALLRVEVDRGLRTRRFLGYRESSEWARAARPVVEECVGRRWLARRGILSFCLSVRLGMS